MNYKTVVSLTLILIAFVCSQAAYAIVVEIPDPNLEAVIRETIGKPEGDITDTDLQGITELDSEHDHTTPDEEKIADLTGLEYCTNLQRLYLDYNQISDISSLANLTSLTVLLLYSNQIPDIQPLVDNSGISSGDRVYLDNNPLNYNSQKTLIPTLEGRGVTVRYYAKGVVTLDSSGPPTWSYTLTHQDGSVYNWFYEGAGIKGAIVTGEAEAAGWTVEYTSTLVTFSNTTPMTSGSLSGFEITGTVGGTGSWLVGRNSGDIEGPTSTRGDVSGDGIVSAYDAAMVLQYVVGLITLTDTQKEVADVSKNGTISPYDAALILQYVIGLIPSFPEVSEANAPILNVTSESELLAEAIKELEGIHLNDEQKRVLEQLKRSMSQRLLPKDTALLQNYPNPFNPETWIPYELAKDVPVTISIYNAKGWHIRTLYIGNKQAGIYLTKDRAVYWDGRDEVGQKVASGLYYYTIEAGEFKATRRMLMVK